MFLIIATIFAVFPTKADTTGSVNTGTNMTGDCHPVISGLVVSVECTTGNITT